MSSGGEVHEIVTTPGMHEVFIFIHTGILIAIAYFVGKKGFLSSLRDRHDSVRKRLVDSKHELDRTRVEIEKARLELTALDQTKKQIILETEDQGRKLGERLIQEAHVNAQRILADAKVGAEQEVKAAGDQLRQQLLREAVKQARASLQGESQKQAHESLVTKFLDDMSIALSNEKSKPAAESFDNGK